MTSRLPAEWEPQSATLLTWPHSGAHWANRLPEVEQVFLEIIRNISDDQKVIVSYHDEATLDRFRSLPGYADINLENLDTFIVPSDDCWTRDHGPITIIDNGQPVLLDFEFNGWNNKYPHACDNRLTGKLHALGAFGSSQSKTISVVLEGGSIETNGNGWLFTTASCLIQHNRNPGHDRESYESLFSAQFDCKNTVWLDHESLAGDDTDGHIDTVLRFCNDKTIVYQQCKDTNHIDQGSLTKMESQLINMNKALDNKFTLVPVPVPCKPVAENGQPLPASYVNFIITNSLVLLPVYGDENDNNAMSVIQECFPDREVIAINALPLIHQYGSLHCTAMQLPSGVVA